MLRRNLLKTAALAAAAIGRDRCFRSDASAWAAVDADSCRSSPRRLVVDVPARRGRRAERRRAVHRGCLSRGPGRRSRSAPPGSDGRRARPRWPLRPASGAGTAAAAVGSRAAPRLRPRLPARPIATRSHFDAQDDIETATPGRRATQDGWMNRLLGVVAGRAKQSRAAPARAVSVGAGAAAHLCRAQRRWPTSPRAAAGDPKPNGARPADASAARSASLYDGDDSALARPTAIRCDSQREVRQASMDAGGPDALSARNARRQTTALRCRTDFPTTPRAWPG